jgi:3-methyladenine DNA glycosylase AlkD
MDMNAKQFVETLKSYQSDKEYEKICRYFKADDADNRVIGVRMKKIFDLAKENTGMSLVEVEKLLEKPYYEARMGAVSIMDFQARQKKTTEEHRKRLFELYINRHDRINSWDFVDRSAPHVVGGYLYEFKKPRDILYKLARTGNIWERRTSIVSTAYFIKKRELEDTFNIAGLLLEDNHDLIHKAVGTWIRHAGKQDEQKLLDFLDTHAASMPRTMLNYAIEKLDKKQKEYYRNL